MWAGAANLPVVFICQRVEFEGGAQLGEACGAVVGQLGDLLVDLVTGSDDVHRG